ncbi:MAG: NGG1p interacting factor NIF3 [Gammaproteobacteria bacterium]|nr:NGG1p interacting factor NIF3 [Gammaproteobacteria bacterium]
MYKIGIFIPATHLEAVKMAMFAAGAGRIGHYDCCAWQTAGQGQFRPLQDSQPFIGQQGVIATVEEYRVEMVCEESLIRAVIAAMKRAHPYETPAYDVWQLVDV